MKSVLTFNNDWTVMQSGPLVAGNSVVVRYHRARLAGQKQLDEGGDHAWVLSGFSQLNGDHPRCFEVGGRSSDAVADASLPLLRDGTLKLWFSWGDAYGDQHFDSDYGRNYCFQVAPEPRADSRSRGKALATVVQPATAP